MFPKHRVRYTLILPWEYVWVGRRIVPRSSETLSDQTMRRFRTMKTAMRRLTGAPAGSVLQRRVWRNGWWLSTRAWGSEVGNAK